MLLLQKLHYASLHSYIVFNAPLHAHISLYDCASIYPAAPLYYNAAAIATIHFYTSMRIHYDFFHVLLYTTKFSNSVKFLASDRPQPTSSKLPLKNNQIKAVHPQSKSKTPFIRDLFSAVFVILTEKCTICYLVCLVMVTTQQLL